MRLLILTEDENGKIKKDFNQFAQADLCIVIFKDNTFKIIKNRYGPTESEVLPVNQIHEFVISRQII